MITTRQPLKPSALVQAVRYSATLLALSSIGLSVTPPQQDRTRAFEAMLARFDTNLDGKVDRDEFPRSTRRFRRADRNGDGFLSLEDLKPADGAEAPATPATEQRPPTEEEVEFFETRVRPVLAEACYSCHAETSPRIRARLKVDSLEGLLEGGVSGPALIPGDVDGSALIEAIRYEDLTYAMPPSGKLDDDQIRDLERWVAMGAPWPEGPEPSMTMVSVRDSAGGESLEREIDMEEAREFWSFQPVTRPEAPRLDGDRWSWTEVDRFLRAAMDEEGVRPVGDADRLTWLRRVTFDLTGLAPTPEEQEAFERDRSSDAHEEVVDRLLASTAFGERFGRHWLDVARFAESSGMESNVLYPHAWRYRDFVVDAVNEDMPFNEFLKKQLAGDLLEASSPDERAENLVATGYLALGAKSHNSRDPREFSLNLVDEQIDAMSQGMLGLTVSCARCHDHKFDPIPIEDYYALAGIFLSTETHFGTYPGPGNNHTSELLPLPDGAELPNGPRLTPEIQRTLERLVRRLEPEPEPPMSAGGRMQRGQLSADERAAARRERLQRQQVAMVKDLLSRFDEDGNALQGNRLTMGAADGTTRDIAVLRRGELNQPGEVVERGIPEVFGHAIEVGEGSGRLGLASWVASKENPLTARVWANRIWLHLFGSGIVRTPDNFGSGGQRPDHPELLDWLAAELMDSGWSTKSLVRELVLSHAYRLDSEHSASNDRIDPDVVTLWRMPDRRLEAEAIRDAILQAAGTLDRERPVGSPVGLVEGVLRREQLADLLTSEQPVRSVYLPNLRGATVDALGVFDAPDAATVEGDRDETSVATQALFMMNNEDVLQASDAMGTRLLALDGTERERISHAYRLALGRAPSSSEAQAVSRFLDRYEKLTPEPEPRRRNRRRSRAGATPASSKLTPRSPEHAAWAAFAQSLFQTAEFRTLY
ncbi:MAG: DUF1553 domain-containing protein [Planctomycetota bacterium]|nr:DUF1553 domain-containing protein [Planctomycetota bacterium]